MIVLLYFKYNTDKILLERHKKRKENKMEYWDIYDEFKNKTGKVLKRGDKLNDDEYHLVTNAWIKNSKGEF